MALRTPGQHGRLARGARPRRAPVIHQPANATFKLELLPMLDVSPSALKALAPYLEEKPHKNNAIRVIFQGFG